MPTGKEAMRLWRLKNPEKNKEMIARAHAKQKLKRKSNKQKKEYTGLNDSKQMHPIVAIVAKFKSVNAAASALGTSAPQMRNLIDGGALVDSDGQVWIKSKTIFNSDEIKSKSLCE